MRILIRLLAVGGIAGAMFGQILPGERVPVAKTDPIFKTLDKYRSDLEATYEKGKAVRATFTAWMKVEGPTASKLFPQLKFASIEHSESDHPASGRHELGNASGIRTTLAVNATTQRVEAELIGGSPGVEVYGKLLNAQGVRVRDESDVKTIVDAYCEIQRCSWKVEPPTKVSDHEWRVNIARYDQTVAADADSETKVTRTHYLRILVDPATGTAASCTEQLDSSARRKVPRK